MKTFALILVMSSLVVMAGGLIGRGNPNAIYIALFFAALMNVGAYWFSDKLALMMAGAKKVSEQDEPRLHYLVDEVARKANMPKPKVFVMQNDTPNAFATGRDPQHAVVAVTTGIQRILNEQELQGVIAHEMAHIRNRDMLIMTIVAVMASAISSLAWMAQWTMILGGHRNDREGGGGGVLGIVGMLVLMIVMPLAAMMVQFAISRTREYSADETGARILGNPLPLANALEKLEAAVHRRPMPATKPNEAMAHMYIVNPLGAASQHARESGGKFVNWFSTHPPMQERVRRLREMVLY